MTWQEFKETLDVTQLCVDGFLLGFLALVWYLRREDKREGYPLERPAPEGGRDKVGFPRPPPHKYFETMHHGLVRMPHDTLEGGEVDHPVPSTLPFIAATPAWRSRYSGIGIGVPLEPDGDPLVDGVGPAAFSARSDVPLHLRDGSPQVIPLRIAPDWWVAQGDVDPRGMRVIAADGMVVGQVVDLWVDQGVRILRYLEVALGMEGRRVLLPIYFVDVRRRQREVRVTVLRGRQFDGLPSLRDPLRVTAREEDRINAYFAGGTLYTWRRPKGSGP